MIQHYQNQLLYSDHAVIDFKLCLKGIPRSPDLLKKRADNLGATVYDCPSSRIEKFLRLEQSNLEYVKQYFVDNLPPVIHERDTIDNVIERFNGTVTEVLRGNKKTVEAVTVPWGNAERWKRLLNGNDLKRI